MRTMVDCRWLGQGGAGRVTQLFLRGAGLLEPPGRWLLWGPEALQADLWADARYCPSTHSPKAFAGQREVLHVPNADISLYLHQIRPLSGNPSITAIYDTVQTRFGRGRKAKAAYLRLVAALSKRIITLTGSSRERLIEDLAIDPRKIEVVRPPFDDELVARVMTKRAQAPPEPFVLYVGRFAEHKNLPRLLRAFVSTNFRASGGRLMLVGGAPSEVVRLRARTDVPMEGVAIKTACSQEELESLYARCTAVVLPSLEEGFGLPAWEAITCGIPVAVSDGGGLEEATLGLIELFPASSEKEMAIAIDRAAAESNSTIPLARSREAQNQAPDARSFAERICDVLTKN